MLLQFFAEVQTVLQLVKHSWCSNRWKVVELWLIAAVLASFSASIDIWSISTCYSWFVISLLRSMETNCEIWDGPVLILFCFSPVVLLIWIHEYALVVASFVILLDHDFELTYFFGVADYGLTVDGRFGIQKDLGEPYVVSSCCLSNFVFVALVQAAWHFERSFGWHAHGAASYIVRTVIHVINSVC